jgi:hypothetical protein
LPDVSKETTVGKDIYRGCRVNKDPVPVHDLFLGKGEKCVAVTAIEAKVRVPIKNWGWVLVQESRDTFSGLTGVRAPCICKRAAAGVVSHALAIEA